MDKATLETLKQLESESTPGPWEVDFQPPGASGAKCYMCGITANVDGARFDVVRQGQTNERTWPRVIKDGDFIATMRNTLPGLLAYVASVEKERDEAIGRFHLLQVGHDSVVRSYDRIQYQVSTYRKHLEQRIKQHQDNLKLWESGFLAPTEPDPEERDVIMRELKACICECQQALALLPTNREMTE